ncbi:MAG: NAD(P)H-binding protein [Candidatus Dormibacteraeota bacterium]|nr:NAD(P)H-binding protein [Candidatus Dormibacteraeota bacterium]
MLLVTGGNGFVGRHVVKRLSAGGERVRAMVRNPSVYHAPEGVEVVRADLTQPETLGPALEGVTRVVHAAAVTGNIKEPYKGAYDDVHRVGTENLVRAATEAGVKRVVAMSGLGTKPAPNGTYMAPRWAMEEAVRHSGIPHVIIQPSVQFGPGSEFINALARLARTSPVVPLLGGGTLRFQPIWVEDVVTCIEQALAEESFSGAYTIGGSEYATFKEVIQVILKAMGKRRLLAPLPMPIARIQARVLTALLPNPPLTPATIELFDFDNVTDLDAVDKYFGFHPTGFRAYIKEHGIEA